MLTDVGFVDVQIGPGVDTFGGAGGEDNARAFDVQGTHSLRGSRRPEDEATNAGREDAPFRSAARDRHPDHERQEK